MTPQERDLILEVARRLRATRLPEKDEEADRLIHAEIGSQRDALYLLTQAVIVQEQGLRQAQERIRQLEAAAGQGGAAPQRGSFLGGSLGAAAATPPAPASAPGPPPAGGGGGGGSFLQTAVAAAAGTIGGQLILDGVRHLFAGGSPLGGGHAVGAWDAGAPFSTARGGAGEVEEAPPRVAPAGGADWGPRAGSWGQDGGSPAEGEEAVDLGEDDLPDEEAADEDAEGEDAGGDYGEGGASW